MEAAISYFLMLQKYINLNKKKLGNKRLYAMFR